MASERSSSQQSAISDLARVLAASGCSAPGEDVLATLLEVEQWDVSRAARLIEDNSAAERRRSGADDESIARSFAQYEEQPFDESASASLLRSGNSGSGAPSRFPGGAGLHPDRRQLPRGGASLAELIWSTVTFPFSLASSLLLFLARLLRLKSFFPGLFGGLSDSQARRSRTSNPRECAEEFVKELEDDTGGSASSVVGAEVREGDSGELQAPPKPRLPSFFLGGYNDALRAAKEQIKILAVILVSREHGDIDTFKRTTLIDADLVSLLSQGDFIVWGGDVREREAYQVATTLQASTYPFVAFISLQPARTSGRRGLASDQGSLGSTPRPAVLSRLEGSPLSATSAATIASHISDVLLPRTRTYLERLRAEQRRRENERELKAEQDRAYLAASRRDAERVMKKRDEESRKAQEATRLRIEQEQKDAMQRQQREWQQWAHEHLVPSEPPTSESSLRLSFRLPSGKVLARRFRASDTVEIMFAYIETASLSASGADTQRSSPPGYVHTYQFNLVTGYPRKKIAVTLATTTLGDLEILSPSANLIVEGNVLGDTFDDDDRDDDTDQDEAIAAR